ncbi:MAG: hypothetical protein IKN49_03550 [Elusimicrobiaceae bacterium]|nr:hypothetical protein [Elusimicrobiaceae bacterium]
MAELIVLGLLAIAAVYGLFFIIFKLIALLRKNKSNKGPLIWAGVATAIIVVLSAVALYRVYQRVTKPFQPIIQTVRSQQHPIYGQRLYIDPQYGFSITTYNGMVFSQWIKLGDIEALAGIDTNIFLKQMPAKEKTLTSIFLLRKAVPAGTQPDQLMAQILPQVVNASSSNAQFQPSGEPTLIPLGEDHIASFLTGVIYTPELQNNSMQTALLITVQQDVAYYLIGISTQTDNMLWNSLQSLRFEF